MQNAPRRGAFHQAVWATVVAAWLLLWASPSIAQQAGGAGNGGSSATRQHVDIVVGLRWREQAELERLLRGLVDPDSPQYERYLTADEFAGRFAPAAETIEATRSVLRDHGLTVVDVAPSRLFLSASGWVDDVSATRSALLTALRDLTQEMRLYFYVQTGTSGRSGGDGGGAAGDGAVELHPRVETVLSPAESAFGPAEIARAYGFDELYARDINGRRSRTSTIAIATAFGFDRTDVQTFWAETGITRSDDDVELVWVNGSTDIDHVETTVDVQWASALAPESPVLVYAAAEPSAHEFLKVYDRIVTDNRAAVMVTSWGACEQQLSRTYLEQAHIVFQRAAAQGITVIAASGDRGADDCESGELSVDFPAADPNVLAVGGTTLRNDGVFAQETVWAGSGGGTSTVWPAPAWQMYPSRKRVLADVAFNADSSPGFASRFGGRASVVGGTSLAAPAWAALIALTNDTRARIGDGPLGVAAPALCEAAHADGLPQAPFRDIRWGDNGGFSAGPGWDFPSGWGSPRAVALVDALAEWLPRPLSSKDVELGLLLSPARPDAGDLRAQLFHQCARTALRLQGRGLASGDYIVSFDADAVASFTVGSSGRVTMTLRARDPRAAAISVERSGDAVLFSGKFPTLPEPSTRVGVALSSTGMIPDASGFALYQQRHGRERFTVRAENLLPGAYRLRWGSTVIALTVAEGRSSMRVTFDSTQIPGPSRPQTPLCDSISVIRDGVAVLRAEPSARSAGVCE